jgi:hypothetical protein
VQSWLNLAKQRALRDQRPVGIRLPAITGVYITELQYVELPGENVGGTVIVPYVPPNAPTTFIPDYKIIAFIPSAAFNPSDPAAVIQARDVLSFPDKPMANYQPRRVVTVGAADSVGAYPVLLDQALPPTAFTTQSHLFARKARPVVGEPVLQLPKDIAIDVDREPTLVGVPPKWYRMFPPTANNGGTGPFDILFAPSGQVIGAEGNLGSRICLWVRDVSLNTPGPNASKVDADHTDPTFLPPGENTLITVYTRTGHVTAHPVDPAGLNIPPTAAAWNPFSFTQDAKSSGQ